MKKYLLYFATVILVFSCTSKTEKKEDHTISSDEIKVDEKSINGFLEQAINKGDTLAYNKAFSIFSQNNEYTDFYFYSMTMANKYNYSRAYYDLFLIMGRKGVKMDNIEMYSDDTNSRRLANYFLIRSYELGLKEAKVDLEKIFGQKIPKSQGYLCLEVN